MMNILKGCMGVVIIFILLDIIPTMIGCLFSARLKRECARNLVFVHIIGLLVMLALCELIAVPMTLAKNTFSQFVWVYSAAILLLVLWAILKCRRNLVQIIRDTWLKIKEANPIWFLVAAGILVPVIFLAFRTTYIYGDDKTYISMVNDLIYTNRLYLTDAATGKVQDWIHAKYSLSAYWTWIAYFSKVSGLHPLILCKTVLMFFYVPMGYAVQGLLGNFLFRKDERKLLIFMLLMIVITVFGGFSNYTVTYRFYTWVWQSKAFLAIVILPFVFYYCNYVFESKTSMWEYLLLLIMIVASCASTLTGTGLMIAMVCILALIYSVIQKKLRILISSVIACFPAYLLIFIYLDYSKFIALIHFNA